MIGYYDGILGLIPLTLVAVAGGLHVLGVALSSAIPAGAAIAGLLVAHAMFVNAPVDRNADTA